MPLPGRQTLCGTGAGGTAVIEARASSGESMATESEDSAEGGEKGGGGGGGGRGGAWTSGEGQTDSGEN